MAEDTFHRAANDPGSGSGDEERTITSEMTELVANQAVEGEAQALAEPAEAGPLPAGEGSSEQTTPAPGQVAAAELAERPWWKRFFESLLKRAAQEAAEVEAFPVTEAEPHPPAMPLPEPPPLEEEEMLDAAVEKIAPAPEEASFEEAIPAAHAVSAIAGPSFTLDDVRALVREEVARAREETRSRVHEELGRAQEDAYSKAQAELAREQGKRQHALQTAIEDLVDTIYDVKIRFLRAELAILREEERPAFRNKDLSLREQMEEVDHVHARIARAEQVIAKMEEAIARRAAEAAQLVTEDEGRDIIASLREELEQQKQRLARLETTSAAWPKARAGESGRWPTLLALLAAVALGVAGVLLPRQVGPAPSTLVEMAALYQASGEREEAVRVLDEAVEAGIDDAETLGQVGQTYYALREYEKAVDVLEQVVESDPQNVAYRLALARSYGQAGQYQRAIVQYERLIESDPVNSQYYLEMGEQYEALEDHDQALAQYRKVAELAPKAIEGYTSQGDLYRDLGRYDAAIPQYQRALEVDPNAWWVRLALGQSYTDMQNWDRAIEQFSAAVELAPDNPAPYLEMGRAWRARGEYEEALSWYQDALDIRPDRVATILEMGETYVELEDCEQAVALFLQVLEKQPNNEEARAGLESCQ